MLGAHREHDRARAMLAVADPHAVDAARLVRQLDAVGLLGHQARTEALGLRRGSCCIISGPITPSGKPG